MIPKEHRSTVTVECSGAVGAAVRSSPCQNIGAATPGSYTYIPIAASRRVEVERARSPYSIIYTESASTLRRAPLRELQRGQGKVDWWRTRALRRVSVQRTLLCSLSKLPRIYSLLALTAQFHTRRCTHVYLLYIHAVYCPSSSFSRSLSYFILSLHRFTY